MRPELKVVGRREMKFKFHHTGIRARDLEQSLRFYKGRGMRVVHQGTASGGQVRPWSRQGSKETLELNWYPRGTRFYTDYVVEEELDHSAFAIKDVKRAYGELLKKGTSMVVSPPSSKGTQVCVKDPDGIWIELLQS